QIAVELANGARAAARGERLVESGGRRAGERVELLRVQVDARGIEGRRELADVVDREAAGVGAIGRRRTKMELRDRLGEALDGPAFEHPALEEPIRRGVRVELDELHRILDRRRGADSRGFGRSA